MPEEKKLPDHKRDVWRCSACDKLMHCIDGYGRPCPGAPAPHFYNRDYPQCCSVCWEMLSAVGERAYFIALHAADRKKRDSLRDGGNYLA